MRIKLPRALAPKGFHTPGQMNQLEADYASKLFHLMASGQILHYMFEPIKLRLGKDHKTTYTPDFLVVAADHTIQLHEVKGHWQEDARVKIKAAAAQYPFFTFIAAQRPKKTAPWTYEQF